MESSTTTPGVRLCHKLTKDHVWLTSFTRMRVNLAAQVRVLISISSCTCTCAFTSHCFCHEMQVMSESVATALEYLDNDATQQTHLFIRMINKFFDCLNCKGPQMARLKRNNDIAPYRRPSDQWFKVKCKISILIM